MFCWIKTRNFSKFCIKICAFSSFSAFFAKNNVEKAYFNQHLECAEPKHWSKYSTVDIRLARSKGRARGAATPSARGRQGRERFEFEMANIKILFMALN